MITFILLLLSFTCIQIEADYCRTACYSNQLSVKCSAKDNIVINAAVFGYSKQDCGDPTLSHKCLSLVDFECWISVTAYVAQVCSGQPHCSINVQYALHLPQKDLFQQCGEDGVHLHDNKPSLFVEYQCVMQRLFTKIDNSSIADAEQVGGFLATVDYSESLHTNEALRHHFADEVCQTEEVGSDAFGKLLASSRSRPRLPYIFHLPAPSLQVGHSYARQETATFVLHVKDLSFSLPDQGDQDSGKTGWRLAFGENCTGAGPACRRDYLEIATYEAVPPQSPLDYPDDDDDASRVPSHRKVHVVERFCLVRSSSHTVAAFSGETQLQQHAVIGQREVIGHSYGPYRDVAGLRFTSNINLLGAGGVLGRGVLLEYVALFCQPIFVPLGHLLVDYRFRTQTTGLVHTVVYADIYCPPGRWLEPQTPLSERQKDPDEDPNGGELQLLHDNSSAAWWKRREQHTQRTCDHHSRSWTPERPPQACITETELRAFVIKIEADILRRWRAKQKPSMEDVDRVPGDTAIGGTVQPPAVTPSPSTSTDDNVAPPTGGGQSDRLIVDGKQHNKYQQGENNASKLVQSADVVEGLAGKRSDSQKPSVTTVVVGALCGVVICLFAVSAAYVVVRNRCSSKYYKPMVPTPSLPSRLNRSTGSLGVSMTSFYPTPKTVPWRRKMGSKADFPSSHLCGSSWSQNLSGVCPDLPRGPVPVCPTPDSLPTPGGRPGSQEQRRKTLSSPWLTARSGESAAASAVSLLHSPHAAAAPGDNLMMRSRCSDDMPWHYKLCSQTNLTATANGSLDTVVLRTVADRQWWLPWRRSLRKQHRLNMQHSRRVAQLQTQPRRHHLVEASLLPQGHRYSTNLVAGPSASALFPSADFQESLGRPEGIARQMAQLTSNDQLMSQLGSSRTLLTSVDGSARGSGQFLDSLAASQLLRHQQQQQQQALYPMHLHQQVQHRRYSQALPNQVNTAHMPTQAYSQLAYANLSTHESLAERQQQQYQKQQYEQHQGYKIYHEAGPPDQGENVDEMLPRKATPTRPSLGEGFRRISSFFRGLNGSLTPPRGMAFRPHQNDTRTAVQGQAKQQQQQLLRQSMSTLVSPCQLQLENSGTCMLPQSYHTAQMRMTASPRAKSDSGSMRFTVGSSGYPVPGLHFLSSDYHLDKLDDCLPVACQDQLGAPQPTDGLTSPWGTTPSGTSRVDSSNTVTNSPREQHRQHPGDDLRWPWVPSLVASNTSSATLIGQPVPRCHLPWPDPLGGNVLQGAKRHLETPSPGHDNTYLEPVNVTLRRMHEQVGNTPQLGAGQAVSASNQRDAEHLPSGTSSAVSSIVFADSQDGDGFDQEGRQPTDFPSDRPTWGETSLQSPHEPVAGRSAQTKSQLCPQVDYATYDLTKGSSLGVSDDATADQLYNLTVAEEELLATQVQMTSPVEAQGGRCRDIRRAKVPDQTERTSRPLSDAMISNHYYTTTDQIYGDVERTTSRRSSSKCPGYDLSSTGSRNRPKTMPFPTNSGKVGLLRGEGVGAEGPMGRFLPSVRESPGALVASESMDSLYERVDHFNGASGTHAATTSNLGSIGQQPQLVSRGMREEDRFVGARQGVALPPRPDSMESLRAPVASTDDLSESD